MRSIGSWLAVSVAVAVSAGAAEKSPACGSNAALRYWMAFAQMENPPARSEVAQRLESVADGKEPWSESLAPIVSHNVQALYTMHRGSRQEFCDWGYEHDMLGEAPIANIPRARTLSRLNVLHGMRLWQQGQRSEAVDAWLAGVRFSRDIAAGGPILSALVAARSLGAHLGALTRAAGEKKRDAAAAAAIEQAIASLPEAGFDWSVAARIESEGRSALLSLLERADDPRAKLRELIGSGGVPGGVPEGVPGGVAGGGDDGLARALGVTVTQLGDRGALRAVLRRARALNDELHPRLVAAFQAPHAGSQEALREIDARASEDPLLSRLWPSAARMNEARGEVVQARAELLALLRGR